ncbi:MAG: heat-inducible transcriptional repressor HrcA [Dehalococcoidia bacterium]|nr:heat-inducible transcriptional repressor HrcA [Dehalococcoidia bacterium]
MLKPREELILSSIIRQYVLRVAPVSSSNVLDECGLDVSSATVRNDVARLEEEGYIVRPHHAAGSMPSDKGYRYHVANMKGPELPLEEQFLINHLFHQVEDKLEEWLNLAVTLLSQQVKNVAIVTTPRSPATQYKHLEMVSIQPHLVLVVLVLHGAKVRQQLVSLEDAVTQEDLTVMAGHLNRLFTGLSVAQIELKIAELSRIEQLIMQHVLRMLQAEDSHSGQEMFLEGWHFLINQPEFSQGSRLLNLIRLAEQKKLVDLMTLHDLADYGVRVVIGRENKEEAVHDCSLVISRYGLPGAPLGSIAVVGPTRMEYERTIAVLSYVSSLISLLVTELYGGTSGRRSYVTNN